MELNGNLVILDKKGCEVQMAFTFQTEIYFENTPLLLILEDFLPE